MEKIKTVITLSFETDVETFESKEFQEVINSIKTGEMKREFEKDKNKVKLKATCTYWTNYKQICKATAKD